MKPSIRTTNYRRALPFLLFVFPALIIAACGPHSVASADVTATPENRRSAGEEEDLPVILTVAPTSPPTVTGYQGSAYASLPLRDARTGASFTLADFAGRTVFVQSIATWCAECGESQRVLRDGVVPVADDKGVVFVSISVETILSDADLVEYADGEGFGWTFAVATPEFLRELIDQFGRSVIAPVMSPHFILAPDGRASPLYMGYTTPKQNLERIRARS